jgi:hypothetical protein
MLDKFDPDIEGLLVRTYSTDHLFDRFVEQMLSDKYLIEQVLRLHSSCPNRNVPVTVQPNIWNIMMLPLNSYYTVNRLIWSTASLATTNSQFGSAGPVCESTKKCALNFIPITFSLSFDLELIVLWGGLFKQ